MYIRLKSFVIPAALALGLGLAGCAQPSSEPATLTELSTDAEKAGYAAGYNTGSSMRIQSLGDISREAFYTGLMHGLDGDSALIDEAAQLSVLQSYQKKNRDKVGQSNLEEGQAFLQENLEREGVMSTDSGLQYEVLVSGEDGPSPTEDDRVRVHYHGTLIDGTVFDSSVDRGTPAEFGVTQVIPGWVEVLQLMKAGDKWKVYIPSDLAYGARGAGNDIGPNSTLIFEIELIEIL